MMVVTRPSMVVHRTPQAGVSRERDSNKPGKASEEEDRVPPQDDPTQGSVQTYAEQWTAETPFLQTLTAAPEEIEAAEERRPPQWYEAPFRDEGGTVEGYGPEAEEFAQFLAELRDEEFDEAVKGLVSEASELYQEQLMGESGDLGPPPAEAERLLEAHFEPLAREAEMLLDRMAEDAGRHDLTAMSEAEVDTFLNRYEVAAGQLSPNSEYFLEGFLGKLKSAFKGAVNLAKKGIRVATTLGLGPILEKLKRLIRPLLNRVLKFALNKLPPTLRPAAQQLAKRFLGTAPDEQPPAQGANEPAAPDQGTRARGPRPRPGSSRTRCGDCQSAVRQRGDGAGACDCRVRRRDRATGDRLDRRVGSCARRVHQRDQPARGRQRSHASPGELHPACHPAARENGHQRDRPSQGRALPGPILGQTHRPVCGQRAGHAPVSGRRRSRPSACGSRSRA